MYESYIKRLRLNSPFYVHHHYGLMDDSSVNFIMDQAILHFCQYFANFDDFSKFSTNLTDE